MSAAFIKGVSDNFGNAQVVYDKCKRTPVHMVPKVC